MFGGEGAPHASPLGKAPQGTKRNDFEIIIKGRLRGKHVGNLSGVAPPTNAEISMPFFTVYRFDANDKIDYERVVMNLSPLGKPE